MGKLAVTSSDSSAEAAKADDGKLEIGSVSAEIPNLQGGDALTDRHLQPSALPVVLIKLLE